MIGGIFFLPLNEFMYFIGAIVALGAWEWANLSGLTKPVARAAYVGFVVVALVAIAQLDAAQATWLLWVALAWWVLAFVLVRSYPKFKPLWSGVLPRALIGLVILLPMWVGFVQIKAYPDSGQFIMYVMLLVWGADVGAYFAGRKFGKHKLAKNVSPGKTWEGLLGGMILTAAVAYVLSIWTKDNNGTLVHFLNMSPTKAILWGLGVAFFGTLGDLFESHLKREAGVKDSGQVLPGHGGILDRFDAFLFAGLYTQIIFQGPLAIF